MPAARNVIHGICRGGAFLLSLAIVTVCSAESNDPAADPMTQQRESLIEEIEADVRATARYLGKSALDPRVMAAMARVPRHEFVPADLREMAYLNRPLPIGDNQTISQPYIVALMTDLAQVDSGDRVLEIGTGSGYQAAVLAELAEAVYTVEILEPLAKRAKAVFDRLGYPRIRTRLGDGGLGWPEEAPFDAIVVTAACPEVPQALLDQLRPGGVLVAPVASGGPGEDLTVIEKRPGGELERRRVLPVRFVPLTGKHGQR